MSLVSKIKTDSIEAMRNKETKKLSTLRLLVAELEKEKVAHKLTEVSGLSDEQAEAVIKRQIKKLDKEIESYQQVGRTTESQEAEKELLLAYLPTMMTEEEILAHVQGLTLDMTAPVGKIIGLVNYNLKGKAEGALIAKVVKTYWNH
jgi:uncharacterized protein